MIVEGEGIGLWTRVRLPPIPLDEGETNPRSTAKIVVFRNVVCLVLPSIYLDVPEKIVIDADNVTFRTIQQWIMAEYGVEVSKSSNSQVKVKSNLKSLKSGVKGHIPNNVTTDKEKMVLEAFKAFDLV